MGALTIEDAEAIEGPDWLRAFRRAAVERALETPIPDTHEEVWRYSRIAELELDEFTAVNRLATDASSADGSSSELDSLLAPFGDPAGVVVVRDGAVVRADLDPTLERAGVRVGAVAQHPDGARILGSVLVKPTDVFADLNNAFTTAPIVVDVPDGVVVERPIIVVDRIDTPGALVFPRLVIRAGSGAQVDVVEMHESADVRALACPVTEIDVGAVARVGYFNVQRRSERFWQIASHVSRVDRDGAFLGAQLAFGGDYARTRTDCRLTAPGADGNLLAGYFARHSQMLDFRTFQKHSASHTKSNLLFKGALDDSSRSVYTGMIRVDKGAKGCDAMQTNDNVKLGDDTWTESVPNLEIQNDDVRCTHASTVGPVDEDQRFYLESRGVPPRVAERLIVSGFYDEVLTQLPVGVLATLAHSEIDSRLELES